MSTASDAAKNLEVFIDKLTEVIDRSDPSCDTEEIKELLVDYQPAATVCALQYHIELTT